MDACKLDSRATTIDGQLEQYGYGRKHLRFHGDYNARYRFSKYLYVAFNVQGVRYSLTEQPLWSTILSIL